MICECGSDKIEELDGETICWNCGLVQIEYRNSNNKKTNNLGSVIQPNEKFSELEKIIKLHNDISGLESEKVLDELYDIESYFSRNENIPKTVKETAINLYKKVRNKDMRGHKIEELQAGVIYYSSRINEYLIDAKEVGKEFKCNKKTTINMCKKIINVLNLEPLPLLEASNFVTHICNKADFSHEVKDAAMELLKKQDRHSSPKGSAAGAIYYASVQLNQNILQKDIAEAAGVTEVTIRNRYKDFLDN